MYPSLIVNAEFDIVHLSGRAGRYLQMVAGEPTQSVLKIISEELRSELRNGLYQALQKALPVNSIPLKVRTLEGIEDIRIHVRPINIAEDQSGKFLLVVFEPSAGKTEHGIVASTTDEPATRHLEEEVARLRILLRASNEQHEFQAEELKAGNEELQAMNEELRSATEELETSKEELQSINEELSTVNQELKVKVEETSMISGNLQNLINSTDIGTIFLDRSLRVVLFTPATRTIFNLIAADYGRPITDITHRLQDDSLLQDAETVLDKLQLVEREAATTDGRTFLVRLSPYRTAEDRIQGVVISFVDITDRKRAEVAVRKSEERQAFLVRLGDALRPLGNVSEIEVEAVRILGETLHTNRVFYASIEADGDTAVIRHDYVSGIPSGIGRYSISAFAPEFVPDWRAGRTVMITDVNMDPRFGETRRAAYVSVSSHAAIGVPLVKEGRLVAIIGVNHATPRIWTDEEIDLIQETSERMWAVAERARTEEALRTSERRLQRMINVPGVGVITFSREGQLLSANDAFLNTVGYTLNELTFKTVTWKDFTPPEYIEVSQHEYQQVLTEGLAGPYEKEYFRKDGSRVWMMFVGADMGDGTIVEYAVDISDRKAAEQAASEFEERYRLFVTAVSDILYRMNADWSEMRSLTGKGFLADTEHPSLSWLDKYIPDSDKPLTQIAISKAIRTKKQFELEHRVIQADGTLGWTVSRAIPLLDEHGEITEWFGAATDITKRKLAEEALRASEEKYRTLFESIDEGFCTVEVLFDDQKQAYDYRFLQTNPAFLRQTGLTDAVGKTILSLAPDHEQFWFEAYGEIAKTGEAERFEHEARAFGRFYDVYAFRIGNAGENRVAILFNDIIVRKRTEELLRKSEEQFRIAAESAVDYAFINMDAQRIINGWSRGAELIFGYAEAEAIGQPADIIFTPEDRAADVPAKEMLTALTKGLAPDERWHQRNDGQRFYASGVMRPIYSGDKVIGFIKVARDMTHQKEVDETLRISEERYRIALQSARMAAWDWDVAANNIIWNDQHYVVFGLQPDNRKIDAAYFMSFVHPEDKDQVEAALQNAVLSSGSYEMEFRIIRTDGGEIRWMSGFGRVVASGKDGHAARMVGVMYDITARKNVEQQKDEFIGIASHELKTPLTAIYSYAQILEDMATGNTPEEKSILNKLNNQLDRMGLLVKDLLDVTRLNGGTFLLRKQRVSISQMIGDTVEIFQQTNTHPITSDLSSADLVVTADQERIQQVLFNLISNAIKYSPEATEIIIHSELKDDRIVVSVRDFGIGMDEQTVTRIFERFYRGGDVMSGSFTGLGLGLYITGEIIRLHDGTIWVESEMGKGSVFYFSLPQG